MAVRTSGAPSRGVVVFAEIWHTGAAEAGLCQLSEIAAWALVATELVAATA